MQAIVKPDMRNMSLDRAQIHARDSSQGSIGLPSHQQMWPVKDVQALLGKTQETLDRWSRRGHFPKAVQLGPEGETRSRAYVAAEVIEWIESRKTARCNS